VNIASLDETRAFLDSPDEKTRARAVRSICPCHGSFDPLRQLTTEVRHLSLTDPSERVRREAKHVLGDALVVNIHDERKLRQDEDRVALDERVSRTRAATDSKQFRRARRRRIGR
jgi:hypothetical protein